MAHRPRPLIGSLLVAAIGVGPSAARAWSPAPAAPMLDVSVMCIAESAVPVSPMPTARDAELILGARAAWSEGRLDDARAMLDEATRRFPRVADHLAVMLGEIELEAGDPAAAKTRFESALESSNPSLRLEARIGRVRALLELDARDAESALASLVAEFPELPDAERLTYARGRAAERRGETAIAVAAYRSLDLEFPGSVHGAEARSRLDALRAAGAEIPPLSLGERIERASRLVSTGPMQAARTTVDDLLVDASLSTTQRRTLLRLSIRIARVEGRFEDVDRLELAMRETGRKAPGAARPQAEDTAPAAAAEGDAVASNGATATATATSDDDEPTETATEADAIDEGLAADGPSDDGRSETDDATLRARRARGAIARLLRGRTIGRAPAELLGELADLAAGGGLDETLRTLVERARAEGTSAEARFAVAMAACGRPGFEEAALSLLSGVAEGGGDLATGARYHRARLLERLGRLEEARRLFEGVLATDRSSGRYYSLWTAQRLDAIERAIAGTGTPAVDAVADAGATSNLVADAGLPASTMPEDRGSRTFERGAGGVDLPESVDADVLAAELETVAAAAGESYPWVGRAADLLRLRAVEEARTELFEALVAHRLSSGRAVHRYGLEGVGRGTSRPSRASASRRGRAPARPTRRPLDETHRTALADVAAALGDHGTAIAFGANHSADARPRAFAVEVVSAARLHGVDPNLLWAVMRVESVYQPRIISYAGAIGLMQIMPRTGRLIAQRLGREDFTTAQLLDPSTNVEFAAWYLRSLIDRFDGHVPLAIAAYNGGPHNVRVWLERTGPSIPLDAFLERIPFDQTHRYVRRVLTHYAAYRARDGLPMIELGLEAPRTRPDSVAF